VETLCHIFHEGSGYLRAGLCPALLLEPADNNNPPRTTTPNPCTNWTACRNNAGRRIQGMAELRQHPDLPLENLTEKNAW